MRRIFTRILTLLMLAPMLLLPDIAHADPADVDAAARGVVRVVIIGSDGERTYPVSHGTGFAITPTQIVTNAHVVRQTLQDDTLRIGIVPSEGDGATFGRAISVSPRNDLALIQITGDLRLPPLNIAGVADADSGEVSAVGYPRNVDMAQGLEISDIFSAQPPVKSRGFLSGRRPSRLFDTILHTAPIAAGNSGGPLLDGCGRVLGVNSFGADSDGTDAEFYFAVSTRELLPFLRANEIEPSVNSSPCRSIADLDEAELERLEREQEAARADLSARAEANRAKRERAQLEAEQSVTRDRENVMAIALLLLLLGAAAGGVTWQAYQTRGEHDDLDGDESDASNDIAESDDDEDGEETAPQSDPAERRMMIAGTVSAIAVIACLALWFTRPGLDEIDRRVAAAINAGEQPAGAIANSNATEGTLICTLQPARSRVTGSPDQEIEFGWAANGCVNGRTQYGLVAGDWSRVFVPNEEAVVSVNRYDPGSQTFRTDRYLLGRNAMSTARTERGKYTPPSCEADNAATRLGDMQGAVVALLPDRPNERLVYRCEAKGTP